MYYIASHATEGPRTVFLKKMTDKPLFSSVESVFHFVVETGEEIREIRAKESDVVRVATRLLASRGGVPSCLAFIDDEHETKISGSVLFPSGRLIKEIQIVPTRFTAAVVHEVAPGGTLQGEDVYVEYTLMMRVGDGPYGEGEFVCWTEGRVTGEAGEELGLLGGEVSYDDEEGLTWHAPEGDWFETMTVDPKTTGERLCPAGDYHVDD